MTAFYERRQMRILFPALLLLGLCACNPFYYGGHSYYPPLLPYSGDYYSPLGPYRRVSTVEEVKFYPVPDEPFVFDVFVRGWTAVPGWSDPQLQLISTSVNRPGEIVLVLVAAPPRNNAHAFAPPSPYPSANGMRQPRPGVYAPSGTPTREGEVIVARDRKSVV